MGSRYGITTKTREKVKIDVEEELYVLFWSFGNLHHNYKLDKVRLREIGRMNTLLENEYNNG